MDGWNFDPKDLEAGMSPEQIANMQAFFEKEARENRIRKMMDKPMACAFVEAMFPSGDYWNLRLTTFPPRDKKPGDPDRYGGRDFEAVRSGDGKWTHAVEANWDELVKAQIAGNGLYFYLNHVPVDCERNLAGRHTNCATNEDVTIIQTLSVDFDGGLPSAYHIEPDIVIKTSQGVDGDGTAVQRGQALWRVAPDPDLSTPQMAGIFHDAQTRLAAHYDPDGWLFRDLEEWPKICDFAVTDLRRVHRLLGSVHVKDANIPQLVTFERRYTGPRRGIGVIFGGLPESAETSEEPTEPQGEGQTAEATSDLPKGERRPVSENSPVGNAELYRPASR